jgi:hypothetical protein
MMGSWFQRPAACRIALLPGDRNRRHERERFGAVAGGKLTIKPIWTNICPA